MKPAPVFGLELGPVRKVRKCVTQFLLKFQSMSNISGENDTLETLDLSWNHLRGKGAVAIGKSIQRNIGLKRLDISWNGFDHQGGMALATSLGKNSTLLTLDLTNNRLSPKAVREIITNVMKYNDTLVRIKVRAMKDL